MSTLGAKILAGAGVTDDQLYAAVGVGPARPPESTSPAELLALMKGSLRAVVP